MFDKLETVLTRYEDMEYRLSLPETLSDPGKYQALIREYNSLSDLITSYRAYRSLQARMEEAKAVIRNSFDFMEFAPKAFDEWNRHYPDFLRLFEENSPA